MYQPAGADLEIVFWLAIMLGGSHFGWPFSSLCEDALSADKLSPP
jgi:hypothetical protein